MGTKIYKVGIIISLVALPICLVGFVLSLVLLPNHLDTKIQDAKTSIAERMPEFRGVLPEKIHFCREDTPDGALFYVRADNSDYDPLTGGMVLANSDDIGEDKLVTDQELYATLSGLGLRSDGQYAIEEAIWTPAFVFLLGAIVAAIVGWSCYVIIRMGVGRETPIGLALRMTRKNLNYDPMKDAIK